MQRFMLLRKHKAMTTFLTKPVKRKSTSLTRDAGKMRAIIVTLYPGNYVGLRPEGTRREETITLGAMYDVAIKMRVSAARAEKAKAKKAAMPRWKR